MKRSFAAFCIILLVGALMGAGSSYSSAAQTKESISNAVGVDIGFTAAVVMNEDASEMFVFVANDNAMPVDSNTEDVLVETMDSNAEIVYPVFLVSNGWFASSNRYLCSMGASYINY